MALVSLGFGFLPECSNGKGEESKLPVENPTASQVAKVNVHHGKSHGQHGPWIGSDENSTFI